jgi:hypothetical protein
LRFIILAMILCVELRTMECMLVLWHSIVTPICPKVCALLGWWWAWTGEDLRRDKFLSHASLQRTVTPDSSMAFRVRLVNAVRLYPIAHPTSLDEPSFSDKSIPRPRESTLLRIEQWS